MLFNFLGANFFAPKSDYQCKKQPILGPIWKPRSVENKLKALCNARSKIVLHAELYKGHYEIQRIHSMLL